MTAEPASTLLRRPGPPDLVSDVDPLKAFDPRFAEAVPPHARLASLYGQAVFSEGPVWWSAREILIWSDIEGRRVLGWHPDGCVRVVIDATPFINGHTVDHGGDLIHCEHGNRRLSRTTPDGRYSAVVETYEGRRFNAPNDVVCAADGALWFTDPAYGLRQPRQGALADSDLGHHSVYRVDPVTGSARRMADFGQPNGLAFAPDGRTLYVSDTSRTEGGGGHTIHAFPVHSDHSLGAPRVFAEIEPGVPDGFRVDRRGWIWTSSGSGVQVFSAKGERLGLIPTPQTCSNCCFGPGERRLFITAQAHLYSIDLADV
ncbi:SMP-30/gluconolactonase/LRE family protein [Methylobacterium frigidaeris]|uniref:Gluconolactonase n=1 Tax=Methylobacterium frigidaeris TaxID=2038277 RepID=A0AA37HGU4_9HYPH|nr:SMP-30/gluconolactonase/LRE family protein [Methylobacterium frigidaeris]PIK73967.1 gluconolactonase [Methylobacterium frigidaeris]GJD65806.1 Gluconolactonase [Methylobacterium frigidaeris]